MCCVTEWSPNSSCRIKPRNRQEPLAARDAPAIFSLTMHNNALQSGDLYKIFQLRGLLIKGRGSFAAVGAIDASDQRVHKIRPPHFVVIETGPYRVVMFHNPIAASKQPFNRYRDLGSSIPVRRSENP